MSQSPASSSQQIVRPHHHPRDDGRAARPRQQITKQPTQSVGAGYTIAHRGRQIRFGPVAFWIVVGTVVIMAGWSITTATYFAFSNDVIKGVIARQAEQQYAYEDRIAELRAQIDRTTSRQLLDQEQFQQKLDELLHRQANLESRAGALSSVTDPATTGSIKSNSSNSAQKPSPIGDALLRPVPLERGSSLEPSRMPGGQGNLKDADISAKLGRVEASLDGSIIGKSRCSRNCRTAMKAKPARCEACFPSSG
jgi:hypothetical protein